MKRAKKFMIFACIFACIMLLASCSGVKVTPGDDGSITVTPGTGDGEAEQLAAPLVVLTDNVATWAANPSAVKFEISVNGALSYIEATKTSKQIASGETFKIRAIGDGVNYKTSAWSNSVTYTAPDLPQTEKYTVVWKNGDAILEVDMDVAAGTMPVYDGAAPVKSADAQYTYIFAGWSPAIVAVNANATYTAVFTSVTNTHTVIWKNDDAVLETDSDVPYGTMPTYDGATPTKAADAQYTYTFSGWSPAVDSVTADTVYMAQFASVLNTYTVTWKNGNSVLETDTDVPYGATPVYNGAIPAKPDEGAVIYTFSGWSPAITGVTGDVTYEAKFADAINKHVVIFYDADGTTELGRTLVTHGENAVYPNAIPTKDPTVQTVYTFETWVSEQNGNVEADLTSITEDISVYAKYTETVRTYLVTFYDWDGTVLSKMDVEYGKAATAPADPTRENYIFIGWDKDFDGILTDVTVIAQYKKILTFSITYANLFEATYPTLISYQSHIGVKDTEMPIPERIGYKFEGWYTDNEYSAGSRVIDILAGSEQDYHLYARWSVISYTITYKDAPVHENPTEYTVETGSIQLKDATWSGLSFAYWTDENGDIVTEIQQGTIGHRVLTANYRCLEGITVVSDNKSVICAVYDEKHGRYSFAFDLGTLQNVVLDTFYSERYDGTNSFSYTVTDTVSIEESVATSIVKSIAQSVVQTNDWSKTTEWIEGKSNTTTQDFTLCPELELEGVKIKLFEYSNGKTTINSSSYSDAIFVGKSIDIETGTEYEMSSTISYVKDTSTSVTKTLEFVQGSSPVGHYRYVRAADIGVFAIVTYDAEDKNYYLDLYSMVYRTFETTLYDPIQAISPDVNIVATPELDFDIPMDTIETYVESVYYVRYDANGGTGSMLTSVVPVNAKQNLLKKQFVRSGYNCIGWGLEPDGGVVYLDEAEIENIANGDEIITLYAIWEAIPYTVKWSSGAGYSITVQRSESPAGASKGTLSSGDVVYYGDVLKITYGYKAGYTPVPGAEGDTEIIVEDNVHDRIYTRVTPNTYTVVYYPNGGNGTVVSSTHTYNERKALNPNLFSREQYAFLGWSKNPKDTSIQYKDNASVINLTAENGAAVELYAIWIKVEEECRTEQRSITITKSNTHSDTFYPGLERDRLKANGYKSLELIIRVVGIQPPNVLFQQDEPYLIVYSHTNQALVRIDLPDFDVGTAAQVHTASTVISLDNVQTDGSFWVQFANSGVQYYLGQVAVEVKAVK